MWTTKEPIIRVLLEILSHDIKFFQKRHVFYLFSSIVPCGLSWHDLAGKASRRRAGVLIILDIVVL